MSDLSPADIIAWFKMKSREYAQTAARLEKDFNMSNTNIVLTPNGHVEQVPLDKLVEHLTDTGAKRPADIAEFLKTTKDAVDATIDAHPEKFLRAERGWIKLKP